MERKVINWYCVSCNHVLGEVLGGEFRPAETITGDFIRTRGPNLVVKCPECGSDKVWYTADPIVRAIYQLVDAIVTVSANRMVRVVGQRMHEMTNFDEQSDN